MLRTKTPKDTREFFKRELRGEPDEPISLLNLGQIRYRQGSFDEARKLGSQHNKLVAPSAASPWLALLLDRKLGPPTARPPDSPRPRRRFPPSPEDHRPQRGPLSRR